MKTAIILDVDNLTEAELELAITLYSRSTSFFAVGIAPLDFQYAKNNSHLQSNKNKFARLADKFEFSKDNLVIIPNDVSLPESSDIKIAQLLGRHIIGKFDQCVVVSNDHSMFMMAVMAKQLLPTWIFITRINFPMKLQRANSKLHGVPVIRAKTLHFNRVDIKKFVGEM